jgi:hypothetical protein
MIAHAEIMATRAYHQTKLSLFTFIRSLIGTIIACVLYAFDVCLPYGAFASWLVWRLASLFAVETGFLEFVWRC